MDALQALPIRIRENDEQARLEREMASQAREAQKQPDDGF